jgi:transcriptional regulator with XRE-family HTH domain|nr:helix-turn-helix transcriptional regulator [Candidatus Krumholzibacteria bacterium]
MSIYGESDQALLSTLGQRLRRARLRRNLSQEQLAERAGINRTTVSEYERGASTSTMTLVQVLRALEMLEELDSFLPEPGPSPLDLARRQGKQRQRATGTRGQQPDEDSREDPSW